MKKYTGIKDGVATHEDAKQHLFSDLPAKGLIKSFEGVSVDEPVILKDSDFFDPDLWKMQEREIDRRMKELGASLIVLEVPSKDVQSGRCHQLIFVLNGE